MSARRYVATAGAGSTARVPARHTPLDGRAYDKQARIQRLANCSTFAELYEFYSQRNVILHEAKVPAAIIGGVFAIEPPAGTEHDLLPERRGGAAPGHVELPIVLDHLLNELLTRLNNAFARLRAEYLHPHYGVVAKVVRSAAPPENPLPTTTATTITIDGFGGPDDDGFRLIPSGTIVNP